jgi:lauroyl/myristoyl acyltransferase
VRWISEPAGTDRLLGRLGRMAAAVRDGRVLFITPDLARRRDDGAPVEFCGREIYLPTGAALLAARTGAPLFMLAAQSDGPRQRLLVRGPFGDQPAWGGRDARRAGIQQRLQWFASELARFLMAQPALWYLWGDKRWTRVLHDDPRYVRRLAPSPAQAVAAGAAGVT